MSNLVNRLYMCIQYIYIIHTYQLKAAFNILFIYLDSYSFLDKLWIPFKCILRALIEQFSGGGKQQTIVAILAMVPIVNVKNFFLLCTSDAKFSYLHQKEMRYQHS